jgi:hypothetical protein
VLHAPTVHLRRGGDVCGADRRTGGLHPLLRWLQGGRPFVPHSGKIAVPRGIAPFV